MQETNTFPQHIEYIVKNEEGAVLQSSEKVKEDRSIYSWRVIDTC
jgi:hypothetical protein